MILARRSFTGSGNLRPASEAESLFRCVVIDLEYFSQFLPTNRFISLLYYIYLYNKFSSNRVYI